ncbi:unnamed protein product [Trypanosoma congolense IL3000]|uniref:WGS project CAEQ00000000 data, annotated contig 505 n=1 Tax=Trypanosoma congolense (strain IL3000) TaxID=1068625 RepID=F9WGI5_TRYCI|nr:unnamed protein product [Trypanosoma congolense IL3000]
MIASNDEDARRASHSDTMPPPDTSYGGCEVYMWGVTLGFGSDHIWTTVEVTSMPGIGRIVPCKSKECSTRGEKLIGKASLGSVKKTWSEGTTSPSSELTHSFGLRRSPFTRLRQKRSFEVRRGSSRVGQGAYRFGPRDGKAPKCEAAWRIRMAS